MYKRRLILLSFFLFSAFCLLIIKFYNLQIIEGEKWAKVAKMQHQAVVKQLFLRGTIYSNPTIKKGHPENPQALVMDLPKFHLFADPESIPNEKKRTLLGEFFSLYSLSFEQKAFIEKQLKKKSRSRKLLSFLEPVEKDRILIWWESFARRHKIPKNALFFQLDYKRSHPYGALLGQLLHTVMDDKEESTYQSQPTGGLELQFHPFLSGRLGKRICFRSPRNNLEMGPILEEAKNGSNIYLTINHYLQAIAERELEEGVKKANAKGGWAIMMQPLTGEIYAMAQYPFFDPDNYREFFNDPQKQEHTKLKAVNDAFEPGSIFKPIAMAIAFMANEERIKKGEEPLFTDWEKISTGSGKLPHTSFVLKDGRVHKYLNFFMALQKSSNIYIGKILQRVLENMGEEWYRKQIVETFGFGKKTNIEFPGESPGMVPMPGKIHPNGSLEWSAPTPYAIGMGHNILVNSLQMIRAFAIIANGGFDVRPTLLKKITKNSGEILFENSQKKVRKRILSKEISEILVRGMKYVTKMGGTSPLGDILGYTEAGKSGTSEKIIEGKYSKSKYLASFIGFASAKNPAFILMVVIDEPEKKYLPSLGKNYHGGVCAAPVFKNIASKALEYLGTSPDDPESLTKNSSSKDWAEEVRELRKTYDEWNQ